MERYKGAVVKSLITCCLEAAVGRRAEIEPGKKIRIERGSISLDRESQVGIDFPPEDNLTFTSFLKFTLEDASPQLRNRVVIIGYDGTLLSR